MNDLVYVQCNANLMKRNQRRKDRNREVLLASETHAAQEWIVDCDQDEVDPEPQEETNGDDLGTNEAGESSSIRELLDEDFESESEEEVLEEVEYESDGVQIIEHCGD